MWVDGAHLVIYSDIKSAGGAPRADTVYYN